VGGYFCAMKGTTDETEEAKRAIALLGGEIETVHEFMLPQTDMRRSIFVIRKTKRTPDTYPRQTAQITKKPL
jgi:Predicted S-adenosylmethionine-dependent methyltransferase involved in bacterial cell division